ncbi:MAG: phage tail sheath subtilisin-like domain-containing protein [Pyrinomonadaceae bacterium]
MPIAPTYPGVYIEEVPSGVRTITGVATSITAFIGRALRGPVDEPTTINSFGDFERQFGGLWVDSMMSYAVRDFYQNGGAQAIIVRVANTASTARISLPTGQASPDNFVLLDAGSAGAWGANLSATVDYNTKDPSNPSAPLDPDLFNLTVTEKVGNAVVLTEKFLGVSMKPASTRFLPRVIEQSSSLVRVPKNASGNYDDVPEFRPQETASGSPLTVVPVNAVGGSDGSDISATELTGVENSKTGIYALSKADLFNLLSIPPPTRGSDTAASVYQAAMAYCEKRRAMLIVDPPAAWGASPVTAVANAITGLGTLGLSGTSARNAALYFPRVVEPDPQRANQLDTFAPSGIIAGVMARTDSQRGVWKAPAGLDAALNGIQGLQVNLNDAENGQLNPLGINCLRSFPINGRVVWGARTLRGADQLADEYKYVPVRRLALYLEESLYRGTQWVVFEPNDEPLWAQIRLNVGAFMHNLFRQGAFQGKTPKDAYLVKCDKETTTQNDINLGIVNILVGFAPLKPAEFVIIKIQQLAGQIEV